MKVKIQVFIFWVKTPYSLPETAGLHNREDRNMNKVYYFHTIIYTQTENSKKSMFMEESASYVVNT